MSFYVFWNIWGNFKIIFILIKKNFYSDRAQTKWKKNALNFYIKGSGRINDTGPENSEAISGNESSSNIDYLRL